MKKEANKTKDKSKKTKVFLIPGIEAQGAELRAQGKSKNVIYCILTDLHYGGFQI